MYNETAASWFILHFRADEPKLILGSIGTPLDHLSVKSLPWHFSKIHKLFFVLFVFVYYNYTHTFDQHQEKFDPLAILFSTVCVGGERM